MEIAPITGIRSVSLFTPERIEAEAWPFVIDESARADDEERTAQQEEGEPGLSEDLDLGGDVEVEPEPEADDREPAQRGGSRIDVTA